MSCRGIRKFMIGAVAGDIADEQREALERHLEQCARCSSEYAALMKTVESVKRKSVPQPTDREWNVFRNDFRRAIRNAMRKEAVPVYRPYRWAKKLVPALALLVIVVGAIIILTHRSPQPVSPEPNGIREIVTKAEIAAYLVQYFELEDIYPSEDEYDLDEQLEEIEYLMQDNEG